jgi:hypothetical protein
VSLREKWEFECSAKDLAEAANKKKVHHKERLSWWEKKHAEIKANPEIEIYEGIGAQYSNTKIAPEAMLSHKTQKGFRECNERINFHKDMVAKYDAWSQVLKSNHSKNLSLNHDDWIFFFGNNTPLAEETEENEL